MRTEFLCISVLRVASGPRVVSCKSTLKPRWFILLAFSYVCLICACLDLSVSSSYWCLGLAAVCDCGTPWTFLLTFYFKYTCSVIVCFCMYVGV